MALSMRQVRLARTLTAHPGFALFAIEISPMRALYYIRDIDMT
ncbi:MAG: hypothetical protein ACU0B7_13520 [Paracoccaceae bacterium]